MSKWSHLYVYQSDVIRDLMNVVLEFVGESEHHGIRASAAEVTANTPDVKNRKRYLLEDFLSFLHEYLAD